MQKGDKRYVVRRRQEEAAALGYDAPLPFDIPQANPDKRYPVPLFIADDLDQETQRVRRVTLKLKVLSTVAEDELVLWLNGKSLLGEHCVKKPRDPIAPYDGLELELRLEGVWPQLGRNLLEIALAGRPDGLAGGLSIEEVELAIEYKT